MASNRPPPSSEATQVPPSEPILGDHTEVDGDVEARPPEHAPRPMPKFGRGDEVGRYVILGRLGAGSMGVVYSAWDPKLDRKVALKLLLSDKPGHEQRLEREAQAMARLTHPNVISVHDVGEVDGRVFMAMEYVEGETLSSWIEAERSWKQVLEVMLDAGRGLAAAHAEGLIHRDFKPDNVMIDSDGRVRVMDFGLVRADEGSESPAESTDLGEPSVAAFLESLGSMDSSAFESQLTRVGALIGTPAYMGPEQLQGREADARSDQFSYCVTLWQCLYGSRPFNGDGALAVLFAITQGSFTEPPPGHVVPSRIRRALERGLAGDPDARWPSIEALLDALLDDPASRRRPWLLAASSLAVAVAAGAAAIVLEPTTPPPPCASAGTEIESTWSPAREAALAEVFTASSLSYADDTWVHVRPQLDGWASEWASARRDACEATQIRHEQSTELLDLRMACLDQRYSRFRALVEVLADADDTVIERAAEATESLPELDPCSDREWLLASTRPPEDPELAAQVAALRGEVDKMEALILTGKGMQQRERVIELDDRILALGWDALIAPSGVTRAGIEHELGDFEAARVSLERAYFAARRSGNDEATIGAAFLLIYTYGVGLAQFDTAERWAAHALAEATRVGDPKLLAQVHSGIGILHYMRSEFAPAEVAFGKALALQPDEESSELAMANINYGTVIVRGDPQRAEEAFAALDLGIAMLERKVGKQHPVIAVSLSNYATVYEEVGRHQDAVALLERALDINVAAAGPDHPFSGLIELNLTKSLLSLEDRKALAKALELARHSAAVHRAAYGERHQMVARSEQAIAKAQVMLGRPKQALPHIDNAASIFAEVFGPAHDDVLDVELMRARAMRAAGDEAGARAHLEKLNTEEISDPVLRDAITAELEKSDHP